MKKYTGKTAELLNTQNSDANSRLVEVNDGQEDGALETTPIQARTDGKSRRKTAIPARGNGGKKAKRQ
jgi:hypothetical protein